MKHKIGKNMAQNTLLFFLMISFAVITSCSDSTTGTDPEPEDPNQNEEPSETIGNLEVTTNTGGSGSDEDGFTVTVDGDSKSIDLNDTVTFEDLEEGTYSVELSGLAEGCGVDGDNPQSIEVKAEETATAEFELICEQSAAEGTITYVQQIDGAHQIFVMDADGSNKKQVTADTQAGSYAPALSPDGETIAFHRRDNESGFVNKIFTMDIDGENLTQLTFDSGDDKRPTWSPDGTQIAYEASTDDNLSIYVMDADGSNAEAVTDSEGNDHSVTWSPDGILAFVSDRQQDESEDIYQVNPDGSDLEIVIDATSDNGINLFDPVWSPDGEKIAYQGFTRLGHTRIFIADRDGSNADIITSEEFAARQPSWSPDGEYIAFTNLSDGDKTDAIWTIRPDGTLPYRITDDEETHSTYPNWSVTAE